MTAPARAMSFLVGKPLRPGFLSDVRAMLVTAGLNIDVHVPPVDAVLPSWLSTSTLIVQRGLHADALASALDLERSGVRFCNTIAGTVAARNRALTNRRLAAAGLPVPVTIPAATWQEVQAIAGGALVVVKAADEFTGRGRSVITTKADGPSPPAFEGPYIVQEHVESDGRDYKVYVVGRDARGVIKMWSPGSPADPSVPFKVDATLAALARRAGAALDLEIYGVDFIYGRSGPVVVDVNPFPGFRGVTDATPLVASYLLAAVNEVRSHSTIRA